MNSSYTTANAPRHVSNIRKKNVEMKPKNLMFILYCCVWTDKHQWKFTGKH